MSGWLIQYYNTEKKCKILESVTYDVHTSYVHKKYMATALYECVDATSTYLPELKISYIYHR